MAAAPITLEDGLAVLERPVSALLIDCPELYLKAAARAVPACIKFLALRPGDIEDILLADESIGYRNASGIDEIQPFDIGIDDTGAQVQPERYLVTRGAILTVGLAGGDPVDVIILGSRHPVATPASILAPEAEVYVLDPLR